MKIRFERINGNQLDPADSYESPWIGTYPNAQESTTDLKGKIPFGITGKSGRGLGCLGLLYASPNS